MLSILLLKGGMISCSKGKVGRPQFLFIHIKRTTVRVLLTITTCPYLIPNNRARSLSTAMEVSCARNAEYFEVRPESQGFPKSLLQTEQHIRRQEMCKTERGSLCHPNVDCRTTQTLQLIYLNST